jgi:hypothetical protein
MMVIRFKPERMTKNTVKFTELTDSDLDSVNIGSLYVQKSALKELGWSKDDCLTVDLSLER